MANLVLRTIEGRPLTNLEIDNNFSNINSEVNVISSRVNVVSNQANGIANGNVALSNVNITGGSVFGITSGNVALNDIFTSNITVQRNLAVDTIKGNVYNSLLNVFSNFTSGNAGPYFPANSITKFESSNILLNYSPDGLTVTRATTAYRGALYVNTAPNSNVTINTFEGDYSAVLLPQGNVTLNFINVPVNIGLTTHTVFLAQNVLQNVTMVPTFIVNNTVPTVYWENGLLPDPIAGGYEFYTLRIGKTFNNTNCEIFASVTTYSLP